MTDRDVRDRIRALGGDTSRGPIGICEFCDFMVQHSPPPLTNSDAIEAATFLRERLFAHMREMHPERTGER